MNSLGSVTCRLALKVVPPHHTGKPATARDTNHVHPGQPLERRRTKNLPDLKPVRRILAAKLANEPFWLTLSLCRSNHTRSRTNLLPSPPESHNMTPISSRRLAARPIREAELNSIVAILLCRTHLQNHAWPSLDDCHRHDDAVGIIDLRHSNFSTKQSDRHSSAPARRKQENADRNSPQRQDDTYCKDQKLRRLPLL
jgi:hypothetical protein